jgi:Putative porin
MRTFVMWLLILGLAAAPAASAAEGARKDASAAKSSVKVAPAVKPAASAKPETKAERKTEPVTAPTAPSALEMELQQLRETLQAQSQELESQRAMLREQQQKMAALETELRAAHENPAATADPVSTKKLETVAASETALNEKVGKLQDQVNSTQRSLEERIKKIGPFSFSGDFRLRDEPFFGGPTNQSQVRNRERFRLRFNATAKLNDEISGGFSLASGDLNDPISTNQTINQFYTRKPFTLDRAFINYNPRYFKALTLTGGKFAYPFYRTELTWDNDLNPEGLAQALAWNLKNSTLKKVALVGFELPFAEVSGVSATDKSKKLSVVYGGQIQTVWQLGSRVKFSGSVAFYNYHNPDSIAFALATANSTSPLNGLLPLGGSSVQNSMATFKDATGKVTNAQFASQFGLIDTIAQFDFDTGNARWPFRLLGDFVQNTRACANVGNIPSGGTFNAACDPRQRRGYWLETRLGRSAEKGDWQFAYTRMFVEREAVMGAFNFSDLRQNTNVSQHRIEAFYQAWKPIQLAFTGLFGRPLVTATSPAPAEPILKRFQFDVIYKF